MTDKKVLIQKLIDDASELLEQAREMSRGLESSRPSSWSKWESFEFGPVYGMGGTLENGSWLPSSESC